MFAILGMEIHLMPDWTVTLQLLIFLAATAILYFFVFRPTLKIIDRRKYFTSKARSDAQDLNAKADGLDNERKISIVTALKNAEAEAARKILKARQDADKIVAASRAEARRILDSAEESIEHSEQSIDKELGRQAEVIANDIIARVVN